MSRYARQGRSTSASSPTTRGDGDAPSRPFHVPNAYWQNYGIARKADGGAVAPDAGDAVAGAPTSGGASLPGGLQERFGRSLGADLGGVRLHTGASSASAAAAVGARAYTVGSDIHFAAGQYDPSSREGQHLLAHEVAHTVQQSTGAAPAARQNKLAVSQPGDAAEHEADRAADAMVAGAPAAASAHAPSVARKSDGAAKPPAKLDLAALGQQKGIRVAAAFIRNEDVERPKHVADLRKRFQTIDALLHDNWYGRFADKGPYKAIVARLAKDGQDPKTTAPTDEDLNTFVTFDFTNDRNFKWTGEPWAAQYQAIGGDPEKGEAPTPGRVVPFAEGEDGLRKVEELSRNVTAAVGRLPGAPDGKDGNIAELALFSHGGHGKVYTGEWKYGGAAAAQKLAPLLSPLAGALKIDLFACDAAGSAHSEDKGTGNTDPGAGKGSFAEGMAGELGKEGLAGRIYGHETAAAATTNVRGREFQFNNVDGKAQVVTADNWEVCFPDGFIKSEEARIAGELRADGDNVARVFREVSRAWLYDGPNAALHRVKVPGVKDGVKSRGKDKQLVENDAEASFAIGFARDQALAAIQAAWQSEGAAAIAADKTFQKLARGEYVPPPAPPKPAAPAPEKHAAPKPPPKAPEASAPQPAAAGPAPSTAKPAALSRAQAAKAMAWYAARTDRYPSDVIARIAAAVKAGGSHGVDEAFVDAVAAWQQQHGGLDVDGEAGDQTIAALFGADIRPAPAAAAPAAQPAPAPSATAAPAQAAQAAAPAANADEWATNAPDDAGFKGEQERQSTSCTMPEVYAAIGRVAPALTHELKVMLVGHAAVEQHDKCMNNNFAGVEGGSTAWVVAWTSTVISIDQYNAHPENYRDWFPGKPKAGVWNHKPAGTIAVQLERGEKEIACAVKKPRPAYKSLDSAAVAFIHIIERKFHKLQASSKPAHQELAARALAGDAEAYAHIVTLRDDKLGILPYNPDGGYPALVMKQIAAAREALAGYAPAPQ